VGDSIRLLSSLRFCVALPKNDRFYGTLRVGANDLGVFYRRIPTCPEVAQRLQKVCAGVSRLFLILEDDRGPSRNLARNGGD